MIQSDSNPLPSSPQPDRQMRKISLRRSFTILGVVFILLVLIVRLSLFNTWPDSRSSGVHPSPSPLSASYTQPPIDPTVTSASYTQSPIDPTATPTTDPATNLLGYTKIVFSSDSQYAAARVWKQNYRPGVYSWNVKAQQPHYTELMVTGGDPLDITWSPKSQEFAILSYQFLSIINGVDGTNEHTFAMSSLVSKPTNSLSAGANSMAWSPDGHYLVVGIIITFPDSYSNSIVILDAQTGMVTQLLPSLNGYLTQALSWSNDGAYIAANGEGTGGKWQTWVWKVASHSILFQQNSGEGESKLAWQPGTDNLTFVVFQNHPNTAVLQVWNVTTSQELTELNDTVEGYAVFAWSPDGKQLAFPGEKTGSGRGVGIFTLNSDAWSMTTFLPAGTESFEALAWSPDGHILLAGENPDRGQGDETISAKLYS